MGLPYTEFVVVYTQSKIEEINDRCDRDCTDEAENDIQDE